MEKVVCYETLSETNFDYNPNTITFRPNCYIDIEEGIEKTVAWYLENKIWLKQVTSGRYQEYYQKMYNK